MNNAIATPSSLDEVKSLPNHDYATTHAQASAIVSKKLSADGPITSKKILFDKQSNRLVYEFYRIRNKEEKFYIIF